jgi:hypothetical protein
LLDLYTQKTALRASYSQCKRPFLKPAAFLAALDAAVSEVTKMPGVYLGCRSRLHETKQFSARGLALVH